MKRTLEEHYKCSPCNFLTPKLSNYKDHLKTAKHSRSIAFLSTDCVPTRNLLQADTFNFTEKEREVEEQNFSTSHSVNDVAPVQEEEIEHVENENIEEIDKNDDKCHEWFPFQSKLEMLLYILLHSKTHIMSDETAKFVWYIMKESGVDMPSLNKVKNMKMGDLCVEDMIERAEDKDGIPFYTIKPSSLLKLEIAKPSVASKLIRYPRTRPEKTLEEQADGTKFKCLNWQWAMYNQKDFFRGDFVMYGSSNIGKIKSFFENPELDVIYAELEEYKHVFPESEKRLVCTESVVPTRLADIQLHGMQSYKFLKENGDGNLVEVTQEEMDGILETSRQFGKPIINMPINLFFDDTSANLSRKWRPLHCAQMQIAGIPVDLRHQMSNVKFLSGSTDVSMMQLLQPIVDDIKDLKCNGVVAFDGKLKREVVVTSDIAACVCDFNMLSEAANHMGPNTKKYCPRCYADSSSYFQKGFPREPDQTLRVLERLKLNNRKELRQRYGVKLYDNCLWEVINPHSDIPVGQLHWLYLGLGKFVIKRCIQSLTEQQLEKLGALLDSFDQSALRHNINADFIKYIDSRQGKDVKSYLQIAPIHLAICRLPKEKVKVVCRLAELSKIFTRTTMFNLESVHIVERKINSLLEDLQKVFPELNSKVKTHMSTHIVEDIEKHGPPGCYVEDSFEKMHGRIRYQLQVQNQHAVSRDTAIAFAEMEILNHILIGGFFKHQDQWFQSSNAVQDLGKEKEVVSFLALNIVESEKKPGLKKLERKLNGKPEVNNLQFILEDELDQLFPGVDFEGCQQVLCKAITTRTKEVGKKNTPVLYTSVNGEEEIGIFHRGYKLMTGGNTYWVAMIQKVEKLEDTKLCGMALETISVKDNFVFVLAENVEQVISLVHACNQTSCAFKDSYIIKKIEQENQNIRKKTWSHSCQKTYYVNKFCLGHKKPKYMV